MATWYEIKAKNEEFADVYLYDEIGAFGISARDFVQDFKAIKAKTINLYVNSPGGDVFDGMAMYDAIRDSQADVTAHINGHAASMATVIVLAAKKVIMSENAYYIIHNPQMLAWGDADQLRNRADAVDKIQARMRAIYSSHSIYSEDEIQGMLDKETWFDAAEAVKAGFAHEVGAAMQAAAKIDLTKFKNVPVALLPPAATPPEDTGNNLAPAAKGETMEPVTTQAPAGATTPPVQAATVSASEYRTAEILKLCEVAGCTAKAGEYLMSAMTVDQVQAELIKARQSVPIPVQSPQMLIPDPANKHFSLRRAIMATADGLRLTGVEGEASAEIERHQPVKKGQGNSFFMPVMALRNGREVIQVRGAGVYNAGTHGAELVFDVPGDFIDMLRNRMVCAQLGAQVLPGLRGPVTFPKQSAAATATWVAENPGSDLADSDLTLTTATLTPKTLMTTSAYSRQLLAQDFSGVESIILTDQRNIISIAVDLACIHGTGASNQPTGVYKTTGVGTEAYGGAATWTHLVAQLGDVNTANALQGSLGWLCESIAAAAMLAIQKVATYGTEMLWTGRLDDGQIAGYRAMSTSQGSTAMNGVEVSGGSGHALIFGDWSQLFIGQWGGLEYLVDPYAKKKQNLIELTSWMICDLVIKQPTAFSVATGLTA